MPKPYQSGLSNLVFKPPHKAAIGPGIHILAYAVDHATVFESIDGVLCVTVYGGKPVRLSEIQTEIDTPYRTVERQIKQLVESGYLILNRTPYGYQIHVVVIKDGDRIVMKNCDEKSAKAGKSL
jgi:hypothetical protein